MFRQLHRRRSNLQDLGRLSTSCPAIDSPNLDNDDDSDDDAWSQSSSDDSSSCSEIDEESSSSVSRVEQLWARQSVRRARQREKERQRNIEQNTISMDDYLSKQQEFKTWLVEEHKKIAKDLTSPKCKTYFKMFVRLWNKHHLPPKYYEQRISKHVDYVSCPLPGVNGSPKNVYLKSQTLPLVHKSPLTDVHLSYTDMNTEDDARKIQSPFSTFGKSAPPSTFSPKTFTTGRVIGSLPKSKTKAGSTASTSVANKENATGFPFPVNATTETSHTAVISPHTKLSSLYSSQDTSKKLKVWPSHTKKNAAMVPVTRPACPEDMNLTFSNPSQDVILIPQALPAEDVLNDQLHSSITSSIFPLPDTSNVATKICASLEESSSKASSSYTVESRAPKDLLLNQNTGLSYCHDKSVINKINSAMESDYLQNKRNIKISNQGDLINIERCFTEVLQEPESLCVKHDRSGNLNRLHTTQSETLPVFPFPVDNGQLVRTHGSNVSQHYAAESECLNSPINQHQPVSEHHIRPVSQLADLISVDHNPVCLNQTPHTSINHGLSTKPKYIHPTSECKQTSHSQLSVADHFTDICSSLDSSGSQSVLGEARNVDFDLCLVYAELICAEDSSDGQSTPNVSRKKTAQEEITSPKLQSLQKQIEKKNHRRSKSLDDLSVYAVPAKCIAGGGIMKQRAVSFKEQSLSPSPPPLPPKLFRQSEVDLTGSFLNSPTNKGNKTNGSLRVHAEVLNEPAKPDFLSSPDALLEEGDSKKTSKKRFFKLPWFSKSHKVKASKSCEALPHNSQQNMQKENKILLDSGHDSQSKEKIEIFPVLRLESSPTFGRRAWVCQQKQINCNQKCSTLDRNFTTFKGTFPPTELPPNDEIPGAMKRSDIFRKSMRRRSKSVEDIPSPYTYRKPALKSTVGGTLNGLKHTSALKPGPTVPSRQYSGFVNQEHKTTLLLTNNAAERKTNAELDSDTEKPIKKKQGENFDVSSQELRQVQGTDIISESSGFLINKQSLPRSIDDATIPQKKLDLEQNWSRDCYDINQNSTVIEQLSFSESETVQPIESTVMNIHQWQNETGRREEIFDMKALPYQMNCGLGDGKDRYFAKDAFSDRLKGNSGGHFVTSTLSSAESYQAESNTVSTSPHPNLTELWQTPRHKTDLRSTNLHSQKQTGEFQKASFCNRTPSLRRRSKSVDETSFPSSYIDHDSHLSAVRSSVRLPAKTKSVYPSFSPPNQDTFMHVKSKQNKSEHSKHNHAESHVTKDSFVSLIPKAAIEDTNLDIGNVSTIPNPNYNSSINACISNHHAVEKSLNGPSDFNISDNSSPKLADSHSQMTNLNNNVAQKDFIEMKTAASDHQFCHEKLKSQKNFFTDKIYPEQNAHDLIYDVVDEPVNLHSSAAAYHKELIQEKKIFAAKGVPETNETIHANVAVPLISPAVESFQISQSETLPLVSQLTGVKPPLTTVSLSHRGGNRLNRRRSRSVGDGLDTEPKKTGGFASLKSFWNKLSGKTKSDDQGSSVVGNKLPLSPYVSKSHTIEPKNVQPRTYQQNHMLDYEFNTAPQSEIKSLFTHAILTPQSDKTLPSVHKAPVTLPDQSLTHTLRAPAPVAYKSTPFSSNAPTPATDESLHLSHKFLTPWPDQSLCIIHESSSPPGQSFNLMHESPVPLLNASLHHNHKPPAPLPDKSCHRTHKIPVPLPDESVHLIHKSSASLSDNHTHITPVLVPDESIHLIHKAPVQLPDVSFQLNHTFQAPLPDQSLRLNHKVPVSLTDQSLYPNHESPAPLHLTCKAPVPLPEESLNLTCKSPVLLPDCSIHPTHKAPAPLLEESHHLTCKSPAPLPEELLHLNLLTPSPVPCQPIAYTNKTPTQMPDQSLRLTCKSPSTLPCNSFKFTYKDPKPQPGHSLIFTHKVPVPQLDQLTGIVSNSSANDMDDHEAHGLIDASSNHWQFGSVSLLQETVGESHMQDVIPNPQNFYSTASKNIRLDTPAVKQTHLTSDLVDELQTQTIMKEQSGKQPGVSFGNHIQKVTNVETIDVHHEETLPVQDLYLSSLPALPCQQEMTDVTSESLPGSTLQLSDCSNRMTDEEMNSNNNSKINTSEPEGDKMPIHKSPWVTTRRSSTRRSRIEHVMPPRRLVQDEEEQNSELSDEKLTSDPLTAYDTQKCVTHFSLTTTNTGLGQVPENCREVTQVNNDNGHEVEQPLQLNRIATLSKLDTKEQLRLAAPVEPVYPTPTQECYSGANAISEECHTDTLTDKHIFINKQQSHTPDCIQRLQVFKRKQLLVSAAGTNTQINLKPKAPKPAPPPRSDKCRVVGNNQQVKGIAKAKEATLGCSPPHANDHSKISITTENLDSLNYITVSKGTTLKNMPSADCSMPKYSSGWVSQERETKSKQLSGFVRKESSHAAQRPTDKQEGMKSPSAIAHHTNTKSEKAISLMRNISKPCETLKLNNLLSEENDRMVTTLSVVAGGGNKTTTEKKKQPIVTGEKELAGKKKSLSVKRTSSTSSRNSVTSSTSSRNSIKLGTVDRGSITDGAEKSNIHSVQRTGSARHLTKNIFSVAQGNEKNPPLLTKENITTGHPPEPSSLSTPPQKSTVVPYVAASDRRTNQSSSKTHSSLRRRSSNKTEAHQTKKGNINAKAPTCSWESVCGSDQGSKCLQQVGKIHYLEDKQSKKLVESDQLPTHSTYIFTGSSKTLESQHHGQRLADNLYRQDASPNLTRQAALSHNLNAIKNTHYQSKSTISKPDINQNSIADLNGNGFWKVKIDKACSDVMETDIDSCDSQFSKDVPEFSGHASGMVTTL